MLINDVSDEQLVADCRQGDQLAFEALVSRYQGLVSSVAYGVVGDFATSEDIAQETFLHSWRSFGSLQEPGKVRNWLCGIARNLARNAERRASRMTEVTAFEDIQTGQKPDALADLVSQEEERLVWETISDMPEQFRIPLVLYYREGNSVEYVAEMMTLSVDAVKQRLQRGRELIRVELASMIEGVLTRSRPGKRFTASVMAGIATAGFTGSAKAAVGAAAGTTLPVQSVAAAGFSGWLTGMLGGLLGATGALGGGYLRAEMSQYERERVFRHRANWRLVFGLLAFLLLLFVGQTIVMRVFGANSLWFIVMSIAVSQVEARSGAVS